MGQYLHAGVCIEITIAKQDLTRLTLSNEAVTALLADGFVDLSLYQANETDEDLQWRLRPELLDHSLAELLRAQYRLVGREPRETEPFLERLTPAKSLEEILAIVKADRTYNLYHETAWEHFSVGVWRHRLRVEMNLLNYRVQGKAILEEYRSFFQYVEGLVRLPAGEFPIAGAIKVSFQ